MRSAYVRKKVIEAMAPCRCFLRQITYKCLRSNLSISASIIFLIVL